jgi:glycosyltransferase involved in cell wall biosynthesis
MSTHDAAALVHQPGRPFEASWREATERAQAASLPHGRVTVSCSAGRGAGGLGRHVDEIVAALERAGATPTCICGGEGEPRPQASGLAWRASTARVLARSLRAVPVPVSHALRTWSFMLAFDADAARRLPAGEHLIAFNGQALAQLRAAARAGYGSLSLMSANPHIEKLLRQHELAHRRYPLEGSWATHLVRRNLAEYATVERIYVASGYAAESFLERGVEAERIQRFPLTPHPRFRPRERPPASERFEIVYVGRLAVHKGVPLLIDAVRRLAHADLRLTLIGGWATRGMRRFVQRACAADPRIAVRPGDPLAHLQGASLCVHPAYEDGFAYAPAEALACGVPLLVSEDTGMKELIDSPRAGLILPTGDIDALATTIDAAYRREILVG